MLTKPTSVAHRLCTKRSQRALFAGRWTQGFSRAYTLDSRQRLSGYWAPSAKGLNVDPMEDDVHSLLIKAGFLQQAYSGVFQMLPLGLRVQEKIERLADKHMRRLGASKLALSSLTSEALWRKSGRLQGDGSGELVRLRSRAKDAFMLSPTHEEEITSLVAEAVRSPKDLPLRLYQISRKYRDERRPRQGLLRAREFVMKDLYTFDVDEATALQTYDQVKAAYNNFFAELKIPYIVADADTGAMGGNLSHEFHFAMPEGEDTVFSCPSCSYTANEELAQAYRPPADAASKSPVKSWTGLNRNGRGLITVFYQSPPGQVEPQNPRDEVNRHALKSLIPDLDASNEDPLGTWLANIEAASTDAPLDFAITTVSDVNNSGAAGVSAEVLFQELLVSRVGALNMARHDRSQPPVSVAAVRLSSTIDLLRVAAGDACPRCHGGVLHARRAVELGHIFHLGTRYSQPLGAAVGMHPLVMGCHGIGVSRTIAAVAAVLRDETGLNWPAAVAPFEAVLVPGRKTTDEDLARVYDALTRGAAIDAVIDDREGEMVSKLKDADIIGYPIIVVLGRDWAKKRHCEVQCRRLGIQESVALHDLAGTVQNLILQL